MKPDFPSLADEIAEPRPDMNIKVAAFTVSEKSSNNIVCVKCRNNYGRQTGSGVTLLGEVYTYLYILL